VVAAGAAASHQAGAAASSGSAANGSNAVSRSQDLSGVTYAHAVEDVPAQFAEAPMLTEMVNAGNLPPLAERLPAEPLVVQPIEIGKYGGTIRVGDMSTNLSGYDIAWVSGGDNHFLRYTPDLTGTEPNIAKSVDVSEDQKTFTIHLRPGIKWSDGQPFSSADVMFTYEDILQNKDITPSMYVGFRPNDTPMVMTAPDENTIVIEFTVPMPRFLLSNLPHQYGWPNATEFNPRHYLEQFHIKYNPNAAADATAAGFSTWVERFNDMQNEDITPERPSLRAMVVEETTAAYVRYVRNPYYWAVDTEGNQLPYIDYAEMERLQDVQTYHAKIVTGDFDYAVGNSSVLNYAVYQASEETGNYKVLRWSSGRGGENFYQFNMNWPEPELQKIHQDARYRRALSIAIDRNEMNEVLFFGAAVPRQMTVLETSVYFKQEYADAWAQFDVDQANALLDELGLTWNGDKTQRLLPNGDPIKYQFDYFNGEGPKTEILELVSSYWRAVGIDVQGTPVTRQLLDPRIDNNEEPMSLWHGDASTDILLPVDRKWVTGKDGDECTIAPLWNKWWETDGETGEEPPEWYTETLDTWREFSETLDPEVAAKMLQSQADNVWSIGTVGDTPWPFIVKNTVGNVPETGIHTWDGLFQLPYHPETLFFKE
jgi:peptide/nickel transport system substrate-binding protein